MTTAKDAPVDGGSLTYLTASDIATTLDPHLTPQPVDQISSGARLFAIFDSLISIGSGEQSGKLVYRIADSLESTDAKTWTLKLKSGIKFTDGTPLDAAAVKFNYERVANPATKSPKAATAKNITSMEVVDPTTLKLTLATVDGSFPATVASDLPYIGSPAAYQADPVAFGSKPVGAGAFMVTEFIKEDHLTLVRNPSFYGGKVHLDKLTFRPIVDESQRLNTVVSGGAQMAYTATNTTQLAATAAKLETITTTFDGGLGFRFNMAKAPFDDLRARQAVLYAIDFKALNVAGFDGIGVHSPGIFGPNSPYFDPKVVQPNADPVRAQRLLDELAAAGKPLSFTIRSTYPAIAQAIQALLANYKNITVKVNVGGTPTDAFQEATRGEFDAYLAGHRTPPTVSGITTYYGSQGPINVGKWNNAAVDAALTAARAATDPTKIAEQLKVVQAEAMKDVPVVMFALPTSTIITSKNVKGYSRFYENLPDFAGIWLAK